MLSRYFDTVMEQLRQVEQTQRPAIEQAAEWMCEAIAAGGMVYVFGPSHAGLVAQEMFYRAGGLVPVSPILPPGLTCDVRPITLTSELERLSGFAERFMQAVPLQPGDTVLVHSVSGRNAVAVEAAVCARERGARVVALTNLTYSRSVSPRGGAARLFEVADLVIDNCGIEGDAVIPVPGQPIRCAPTSTVIGCAIANALVAETVQRLQQRGIEPPVFLSANLDGGDAHNRTLMERYRDRLTYL